MVQKNRFIVLFMLLVLVVGFFALTINAETKAQETRPSRMGIEDIPHLPNPGNQEDEIIHSIQSPESVISWSKIAFQSYRDGNWNIYVGNDDGTGQIRLTNNDMPEIHPHSNRGNTKVVFARKNDDYEVTLQ